MAAWAKIKNDKEYAKYMQLSLGERHGIDDVGPDSGRYSPEQAKGFQQHYLMLPKEQAANLEAVLHMKQMGYTLEDFKRNYDKLISRNPEMAKHYEFIINNWDKVEPEYSQYSPMERNVIKKTFEDKERIRKGRG